MMTKVAHIYPGVTAALSQFQARQSQILNSISLIDEHRQVDSAAMTADAALRQEYQRELRESPPVSIQPLYLNITMYFWPIMYFGLGSVAFIMRPPISCSQRFIRRPGIAVATTASLFIFNQWALFLRTMGAKTLDRGRTVFAFSNPDIAIGSFLVQNLNFLVFSILLAIIWVEWAEWGALQYRALSNADETRFQLDSGAIEQLSKILLQWQVVSLGVSVGFIVYTAIFWDQIIVNGDRRFGFEAINAHVLWLVTLVLVSIPLALAWHKWQKTKLRVLTELVNSVTIRRQSRRK